MLHFFLKDTNNDSIKKKIVKKNKKVINQQKKKTANKKNSSTSENTSKKDSKNINSHKTVKTAETYPTSTNVLNHIIPVQQPKTLPTANLPSVKKNPLKKKHAVHSYLTNIVQSVIKDELLKKFSMKKN